MTRSETDTILDNYPEPFAYAVSHTLQSEGLFSDHAKDPGGATMYGITQAVARRHGIRNVRSLTVRQAIEIYYIDYWMKLKCNDLSSEEIATELFDAGVNTGLSNAVKFAQRAYNVLRNVGEVNLIEDGRIGPNTVHALNSMSKKYSRQLLMAMNGEQYRYYKMLVDRNPDTFRAFIRGWMRRLEVPE